MQSSRIQDGWREVSQSEPCEICGKPDWCSRNTTKMVCRRQADHPTIGRGEEKTDSQGSTYYLFRMDGDKPKSRLPVPTCEPSPERADADTLHRVYSAMLTGRPWSQDAQKELFRRNLSDERIRECLTCRGYAWQAAGGRARVAKELIEKGCENDLAHVPGFVIREKDCGRYWTIKGYVGLLIPVRDIQGRIVAIVSRPQNPPDPKKKYRYLSSKGKDGGSSPGSPIHVPVHDGESDTIRITEGVLKADLATMVSGVRTIGMPGVNAAKRAAKVAMQLGAKRVLVAFDADWRTNPNVAKQLQVLIAELLDCGFEVAVEIWDPSLGKGIDDVLLSGGTPNVVTGEALKELRKEIETAASNRSATDSTAGTSDRVSVEITNDEHKVNDAVVAALTADPDLFQRAGQIVRVASDVEIADGITRLGSCPRIAAIAEATLRERVSRVVDFKMWVKSGENSVLTPTQPPSWSIRAVHARGFWPSLRPLSGLITSPVVRADGTVLATPGYDERTGLYLHSSAAVTMQEDLSQQDAMNAADRLLDVFADFPFGKPEHCAALLAFILTPLARYAFSGPAPLFLIDANVRGSGKSLLVDLVSIIVLGHDMPRMSNPRDDDEARKRITALAIAGDPMVLIDNIAGSLGSASLDAALTSTRWQDRILGRSELVTLPLNVTWAATGNNVALLADTSRRVLHIRLESPMEQPELRTGFRHPDIRQHVRENRSGLLSDALTVLSAYLRAKKPDQKLAAWGSFEGWSATVRQAIVWCGLPDPGLTREELVESADREAVALRQLLSAWDDIDPDYHGLSVGDLLSRIKAEPDRCAAIRDALLELCPPSSGDLPSIRQVGSRFSHLRGRIVGGRALDYRKGRARSRLWRVVMAHPSSGGGDSSAFGDSFPGISTREEKSHTLSPVLEGGPERVTTSTRVTNEPPAPAWNEQNCFTDSYYSTGR